MTWFTFLGKWHPASARRRRHQWAAIASLFLCTSASADDKTDAYEASAARIVAAYYCRPFVPDGDIRYENAVAASRERMAIAGYDMVEADAIIAGILGSLEPAQAPDLSATLCNDLLRAVEGR